MNDHLVAVPEGKSREWEVSRFTVPENDPRALRYALHGRPVPPGTYTRLTRNGHVIMSDTPAEVDDHREVIARAKGRVLINGLGLGVVLKAILGEPGVDEVDVVELSGDVIDLVAPTYEADPRVTIHYADAFTLQWARGYRWDVVWHDIWDDLCTDNLPEMTRLHRKYARRADWQGSWGRELVQRMKRQGW